MGKQKTELCRQALRDLRSARRRRYVENLDVMEILYRLYVVAIFGGWGIALFAGVIHDSHVDSEGVSRIAQDGPALIGMGVALALFGGLRSGARGGPLAIEPADLQHVLLAPIDRSWALRSSGLRQLRTATFVGTLAGLLAANFAFRRLPGPTVEWLSCLALFGGLAAIWVLASAMLASGRRLKRHTAAFIGLAAVGWSLADYLGHATTSPATMLGDLAVAPLRDGIAAPLPLAGACFVALTAFAALRQLGGLSLEAAERRAGLAAQLRFAATVQDIRAVVLLRRQLAGDRPRPRPWVRLGRVPRQPILRRGFRSYLRWPASRVGRVIAIGVAVGLLMAASWSGTTPLFAFGGLIFFVAGLDAVEPLAQEVDHPTRRDLLPIGAASLIRHHLVAPMSVAVLAGLIAVLTAAALGAPGTALAVGTAMLLPTALLIACCAALSATNDPYAYVLTPELGFMQAALPPIAAIAGVGAPAWVAREALAKGHSAAAAALGAESVVAIACAMAIGWLGQRIAARVPVQAP